MTVVVGYVPTETGYLAVTEAIKEAVLRGGEIVVVNVVQAAGFAQATAADQPDLDALAARLSEAGVGFEIRQRIRDTESVAEEILSVAEEKNAELIVVGLHRRSPVGKALLGSNAQRVLLSSTCPVLAVRHPEL
jgi:nucleotide-binding universal stress UspA family protein